jgi:uncharacterized protein (TIGR01244 family)
MRIQLLFLALVAFPACATPSSDAAVEDPIACAVEGLPNCAQTGSLTFGGQPSPATLERLAAQGYRTVINTRGDGEIDWDEQAVVESLGMRYVSIPMAAPLTQITDEQVADLAAALENNEGPMLLHCGSGNRVSGLWGAWLADSAGLDAQEALRLAALAGMTGVRPIVEDRLGVTNR